MVSREHHTLNTNYKKPSDGVIYQPQRLMNAVTPGRSNNGQLGSATIYSGHYAGNSKLQTGQVVHRNSENTAYYAPSTSKFGMQQRSSENTTSYYGPPTSKFETQQRSSVGGNATATKLPLMSKPVSISYSTSQKIAATSAKVIRESQSATDRLKIRKFGDSEKEKLCILTGTVERIIKYGKIFQHFFCYFQVFGSVVSIADGKVQFEKTMLLRDKKGPILQLTYYSNATHINIEDFHLGQNLRAVGRMVGPNNVMSAISIRAATDEELEILPRLCYISDYAVSALCGNNQLQSKP